MLAASGILFYVSYWLVSQLEAKRWMDFLKNQARHGLELGGKEHLLLRPFWPSIARGRRPRSCIRRCLGSEGRTQAGFLGLTVGLGCRFGPSCRDRRLDSCHQRATADARVLQVLWACSSSPLRSCLPATGSSNCRMPASC